MDLVPILFKIRPGVTTDGKRRYQYPAFHTLDKSVTDGLEWNQYVDAKGIGFHYDQTITLAGGAPEQLVGTCVPESYAKVLVTEFKGAVEVVSEEVFEDFYNNKAHVLDPVEIIDNNILQSIILRKQAEDMNLVATPAEHVIRYRADALDPQKNVPGIRENINKYWQSFKRLRGVSIKGV